MSSEATPAHELSEITPNTSLLNNETTSIVAHRTKPEDDDQHAINYRKPTRGLHSKLLNFLRQFRLQPILPGSNREHRKVAIHRSRIVAAMYSLLHVTPLAGAIALLVLQWTNYWVGTTDDYSSMLQFAAKGLELAMQASIVEILLGIIRTGLVDDLLPLGTLSAAIQPTQLSFLWSLDYLSCFRSQAFQSWQKVVFVVAIPVLIALTALVGPSGAVLMIPRAGTPRLLEDNTLWGAEPTAISYPQNLSTTRFDIDLQEFNRTLFYSEPQGSHVGRSYDRGAIHSMTLFDINPHRIKRILRIAEPDRPASITDPLVEANVTVASEFMTNRDGHNPPWQGNTTESVLAPYPFVTAQCWRSQYSVNTTSTWIYMDEPLPYASLLPNLTTLTSTMSDSVETATYEQATTVYFRPVWVPIRESADHTLLVVFFTGRTQENWTSLSMAGPGLLSRMMASEIRTTYVTTKACSISTYWTNGHIKMANKLLTTDFLSPTDRLESQRITLDPIGGGKIHSAMFHKIIAETYTAVNGFALNTEGVLAAAIAILIAKVPLAGQKSPLSNEPLSGLDGKDVTAYEFITTQYGYGYGTRSPSTYLSTVVLSLYCVIATAYLLQTLVKGAASTAWNSGVELIALAIQSKRPDHLGHVSAGIDCMKTLSEGIGIRVNKDNELELVFARDRDFDTRGLRKLERNTKY